MNFKEFKQICETFIVAFLASIAHCTLCILYSMGHKGMGVFYDCFISIRMTRIIIPV